MDEAPVHAVHETATLTGTLSRSDESGKFVLTLGDGRTVKLAVDAVKRHKVLGSSGAQAIVEVEVDVKSIPADTPAPFGQTTDLKLKPLLDTFYTFDHPKSPFLDTHPGVAPDVTIAWWDPPLPKERDAVHAFKPPLHDHSVAWFDPPPKPPFVDTHPGMPEVSVPVFDKPPYDEVVGPVTPPFGSTVQNPAAQQGAAPFSLAAARQAPANALAALQNPWAAWAAAWTGVAQDTA
ncbi:hypothetical protein D7S86_21940 [Pararobbsia silviterrae]|uniref:Uncharacterized protein n=1 Tax=Pararobbsia silviterrae TaxID=1792498 RepID=A0A494XKR7_9BURK|nr:hypothetical protein D7S86_21940 [Pararobbsia silviterrae]